ncbi:hypothetical protein QTP88_028442 [Uroleucon formosanum]
MESEIADHLFPNPPATDWALEPHPTETAEDETVEDFTLAELAQACKRLPPGKATGPDGIPNEVLAKVFLRKPNILLSVYNNCLANTTFPSRWKESRLVLLHKGPSKPTTEPSSYRPLYMLDSSGKLLERLILARLDTHLDSTGHRSPNQYGFRQGSSTSDAMERLLNAAYGAALGAAQHRDICVAVSLDVKNAFNTAPWKKVDNALRAKNVPSYLVKMIRSYLQDRSILVGETLHRRSTTCGVPQGSVLGPALWNVFYDDLLDMETPSGVQLVAFADDVCVIGIARTGEAAATLLNPVLAKVSAWMEQNGLKLAPTKTEAVVLTRKNKYDNPELLVEGHVIPIKQSMRYIGVEIDTRLSFTKHIQQASRKATDSATAIARLMPNIGGPSQSKRALLGTVANSKMLYASPTWAVRGTKTAKNRAELARAQRTVALRITRAYRTVSGDASSVLASMLPADLLATERARVRVRLDDQTDVAPSTVKNQERIISIAAWQARLMKKNIERLNTFDIAIYEKEIEEFNFIRSFKEWTKSISNRCKIKIQGIQGIGDNAQFEIELETYIVNAMKLFPCWSSIMVSSFGNGDPTVSSSRVESNFNQLKNRLYKQQVMPLRVDTFIQEILPYYRETFNLANNVHIDEDSNCNIKNNCITSAHQSEQELYAIVHTSTLLLSSHTFNEDNVYSNSLVLDEHSYKCLMCENGDLRTGMHRYRLCKKALHLFGCSVPANQTKEDCGEAPKSYFNKQPTFEHVVFNKKGLFKPIIHLKNGSSLCHKPILIPGTRKLVFSNTYSADSLLSILACSSAADSIGYKKILTHAKVINNTAQFILKMITQSSLKNIYKERALLLLNNFDNNMQVLVGGLKQLNIIGTIKKVAEKLIEEFPFYRRINERTDYLCENVSMTETSSTIIYLNVFHGHIDLEREILHFYLLISKVYTVPKCVCGTKLDMAPERGKKSPSTVAAKGDADEC